MLVIRWSPPNELDISASAIELREVALAVQSIAHGHVEGRSFIADQTVDAAPYEACLKGLTIRRGTGPVRVSVESAEVKVLGSPGTLAAFSSFFDFPDDAPFGSHSHHEWFEGNDFVAKDSVPLVVSVE